MPRVKPPKGGKAALELARKLKKAQPGYPWGNYLRAAWAHLKKTQR